MPHQCVRCNTFYEDAAEEILKESEHHDLIVIGSLGRKSSGKFIMGNVAYNVVTTAKKPVLIYR